MVLNESSLKQKVLIKRNSRITKGFPVENEDPTIIKKTNFLFKPKKKQMNNKRVLLWKWNTPIIKKNL